jgi:hypothetical protein
VQVRPRGSARELAMTMDPEWSDFKVLLALARGGSLAAAARLLEVDAPTRCQDCNACSPIASA